MPPIHEGPGAKRARTERYVSPDAGEGESAYAPPE